MLLHLKKNGFPPAKTLLSLDIPIHILLFALRNIFLLKTQFKKNNELHLKLHQYLACKTNRLKINTIL